MKANNAFPGSLEVECCPRVQRDAISNTGSCVHLHTNWVPRLISWETVEEIKNSANFKDNSGTVLLAPTEWGNGGPFLIYSNRFMLSCERQFLSGLWLRGVNESLAADF